MGCYIRTALFKKTEEGFEMLEGREAEILTQQSYGMFAFLAGVRNYSGVTPLAAGRELPEAIKKTVYPQVIKIGFGGYEYEDDDDMGGILGYRDYIHSVTWVGVDELFNFDYEQRFEDRRANSSEDQTRWGDTLPKGQGVVKTYREYLGKYFFNQLKRLAKYGDPKKLVLVMAFDG